MRNDGVVKHKPKRLSRLAEIRRDACSARAARIVQKSIDVLMRSREVVAHSKTVLIEIRKSGLLQKSSAG
jgi:hypothetical protein